jgi:hypothetical protein
MFGEARQLREFAEEDPEARILEASHLNWSRGWYNSFEQRSGNELKFVGSGRFRATQRC